MIVFRNKTLSETYFDRDVEKAFMAASATVFSTKTKPSLRLASQVGNMYTPSLYGGLVSLLARCVLSSLIVIAFVIRLLYYNSLVETVAILYSENHDYKDYVNIRITLL